MSSGSGRRQWFFFWEGGIGNRKRRRHGPWSSSYVRFMSGLQTVQNLCIYVLYYLFCITKGVSVVVVSLYVTGVMCWFGVCWGHGTDVSRTGMYTTGFGNQGSVVVFGYTYVSYEHYTPNIYGCIHI